MTTRRDLAAWLARIGVEHPRGVHRGLDHVAQVAARLGVNPPAPTAIVVAGTNGKGSTTAFAEQLLLAAGRTVGTTTSPHVHVFNERIRVNGEEADDAAIVAAFEDVEAQRGDVHLSYFEYAILAALVVIARADVEFAVLEVGLGGRLDAVNVVDADVAVVTSIGLDHQEYLGATREAIGAEKAGILRPGVPVVVGEPSPPASVLDRAAALDAAVHLAGRDFGHRFGALWVGCGSDRTEYDYPTAAIDPANAATALQAVRLAGCRPSPAATRSAARSARNPGRFEVAERRGRTWILDVAHNAAGAEFLAGQIRARFPARRLFVIAGCLADKDIAGIVAPLRPLARRIAYADTHGPRGRRAAHMRDATGDAAAFAGALGDAMAEALASTGEANDAILVCGSFDLIERARIRLDLRRPAQ